MNGATVAAHQRRIRDRAEEEQLTPYTTADLADGWEFKIVRSVTGGFGKPETLQAMLAEEAVSGWQMVEKFDNERIRLKRPRRAQEMDAQLPPGIDPYRSYRGISEGQLALAIIGVIAAVVGVGIAVAALTGGL
jgi:hypothetical protein